MSAASVAAQQQREEDSLMLLSKILNGGTLHQQGGCMQHGGLQQHQHAGDGWLDDALGAGGALVLVDGEWRVQVGGWVEVASAANTTALGDSEARCADGPGRARDGYTRACSLRAARSLGLQDGGLGWRRSGGRRRRQERHGP